MKNIKSYLGCRSELFSKLGDLIRLYSSLMEIDKKTEVMKLRLKKIS